MVSRRRDHAVGYLGEIGADRDDGHADHERRKTEVGAEPHRSIQRAAARPDGNHETQRSTGQPKQRHSGHGKSDRSRHGKVSGFTSRIGLIVGWPWVCRGWARAWTSWARLAQYKSGVLGGSL